VLYRIKGLVKLKLSKCHFAQKEVKYLGHNVSEKGIAPYPRKIVAALSYPPPQRAQSIS